MEQWNGKDQRFFMQPCVAFVSAQAKLSLSAQMFFIMIQICAFLQIPKEIGLLHSLSCFDVSHNKELRHLPYEMGNLEYLFMVCVIASLPL